MTANAPNQQADRPGRASLWRAGALAVVTLAFGVLAACSSSGSSNATGTTAPANTVSAAGSSPVDSAASSASGSASASQSAAMIHISNYMYRTPTSVSPGATVSVMNMDGVTHTVSADSGSGFDVTAPVGKVVTFTAPMKPGSYPFHCDFHANMHGVLVVK